MLWKRISGAGGVGGAGGGWDLTNASYDGVSFDVSSQSAFPQGVHFKPDGTKMFVVEYGEGVHFDLGGSSGNGTTHQYSLSTAWDVSTASYDSVSLTHEGGGRLSIQTIPFDATGVSFSADGSEMVVVGGGRSQILQGDFIDNEILTYTLSTPWDLSAVSLGNRQPISPSQYVPLLRDVAVESGGTFIAAFTAVFDAGDFNNSFDASGQTPDAQGLDFRSDGTRMFLADASNAALYQYTLSTPFDLATASYDGVSFDVSAEAGSPTGVHFRPDGTKMFVVDGDTDKIYQYSL